MFFELSLRDYLSFLAFILIVQTNSEFSQYSSFNQILEYIIVPHLIFSDFNTCPAFLAASRYTSSFLPIILALYLLDLLAIEPLFLLTLHNHDFHCLYTCYTFLKHIYFSTKFLHISYIRSDTLLVPHILNVLIIVVSYLTGKTIPFFHRLIFLFHFFLIYIYFSLYINTCSNIGFLCR